METGKVASTSRDTSVERFRRITVEVSSGSTLKTGDVIEIRKVWTDEQLGARLRLIVSLRDHINASVIRELARSLTDDAGWPALAELILDVNDLDES